MPLIRSGPRPITGEETIRVSDIGTGATPINTGQLRLTYFQAQRTETITQILQPCGSVAAAATPTLIRVGIYTPAMSGGLPNGDLTLAASTPNDTTLLAVPNTEYTKALSASFVKKAGSWYVYGLIVVTGATAPQVPTESGGYSVALAGGNGRPRLAGLLSSQTDLPSTITAASLSNTTARLYALLMP